MSSFKRGMNGQLSQSHGALNQTSRIHSVMSRSYGASTNYTPRACRPQRPIKCHKRTRSDPLIDFRGIPSYGSTACRDQYNVNESDFETRSLLEESISSDSSSVDSKITEKVKWTLNQKLVLALVLLSQLATATGENVKRQFKGHPKSFSAQSNIFYNTEKPWSFTP